MRSRASPGLVAVVLILGIVLLCGPACSTLGTLSGPRPHPWLLSGTRQNIRTLGAGGGFEAWQGILQCIAVCDFLFSLALDVAVIPFTIPMEFIEAGSAGEPRPSSGDDSGMK